MYKGKIRVGKFGNYSDSDTTVFQCNDCKAGYFEDSLNDYESETYRNLVDVSNDHMEFYKLHDFELAEKVAVVGTRSLRGKIIADIGAGCGGFLDMVKGMANAQIAIEPNQAYAAELALKGYDVFPYTVNALEKWKGKVDLITCFATIEHLEDPLELIQQAIELLVPGEGRLLVSTPNYDDWLIDFLPDDYAPFFYRFVHKWYFNGDSLSNLGKIAGFKKTTIKYFQQYDIGNCLLWIKDKCPQGLNKMPKMDGIDSTFRSFLEMNGKSNFVYAWFEQ